MKLTEPQIYDLIDEAIAVRNNAYALYSNFKVGAILIDSRGNKYSGVNVENVSFGLTNCAERTAIYAAVTDKMQTIDLIVVVGDTPEPIAPCGACRQVIAEFALPTTHILMANLHKDYAIVPFTDLLPTAFQSTELKRESED